MPELDGIKATKIIVEKYPQISVIGLTNFFNDESQKVAMLEAGARVCLPKNASIQDIVNAIHSTHHD